MISAPSRSCSSLPSRSATSSTTSFSSIPSAPIVPESCPPWPASITIRPIFSPSARTSEVSPSAVGTAARAGVASATVAVELPAAFALLLCVFLPELAVVSAPASVGVTTAAFVSSVSSLEP